MSEEHAPQETPSPVATWHSALDDDLRSALASKGWDKLDPPTAALELTKAWKAAERMVGLPADQIVRLPKDAADLAGWETLYSKLGVPKDPTAYDFGELKRGDGQALPVGFVEKLQKTAAELHLPVEAARKLAQMTLSEQETAETAVASQKAANIAVEQALLRQNWGTNYEINEFLAKKAIETLGLPAEFGAVMQETVGYAKAMEALRNIGARMQEAPFHTGNAAPSPKGLSRDEATARMEALKQDSAWFQRLWAGGAVERSEFELLTQAMTSRG